MKKSIGIIGFGNMGQAVAERTKSKYNLFVFDIDKNKTAQLKNINVSDSISVLAQAVDVIILAVKPQDCDSVLNEIKGNTRGKLIISIAAGITTGYMEEKLGDVRVVKAMPNMPAKIGEGITCLYKGSSAATQDLNFSENLFGYLGETLILEKEELMHAATAVSGSGPAYVCDYLIAESFKPDSVPEQKKQEFLEDFKGAAMSIGFNLKEAGLLVNATYTGTIDFMKKTKIAPEELKKQVTSKGGTTEAALSVRHKGGTWEESIKAAKKRAEELSKKE